MATYPRPTAPQNDDPLSYEKAPSLSFKDAPVGTTLRPKKRNRKAEKAAAYAAHREENQARARAYRLAHREELRLKNKQRYQERRAARLATAARYRASHREAIRAAKAAIYAADREEVLQERKVYYAKNRAKCLAAFRIYTATHRHVRVAIYQRRKARQLSVQIYDFTSTQWEMMKKHYGYHCVYCGTKPQELTQDHITPVIQGGNYTLSNIVPACRSCNSKKKAGPPLIPVQPLLCL